MADATAVATSDSASKLPVLQMGSALAVSFAICKAATFLTNAYGIQGGDLPAITAIVVILATLLPRYFRHLAPAGDAMSVVLMQVKKLLLQTVLQLFSPFFFLGYISFNYCYLLVQIPM